MAKKKSREPETPGVKELSEILAYVMSRIAFWSDTTQWEYDKDGYVFVGDNFLCNPKICIRREEVQHIISAMEQVGIEEVYIDLYKNIKEETDKLKENEEVCNI